jgi:N-methylhydantoinase A
VLGLLDPDGFLGGRVKLDRQQSIAALDEIASRLGMPSAEAAAEAAVLLATVKMASELFKLLAQKGVEPSHHVLVPFGGAGPTHSVLLAQEAGLAGVAVPNAAATFCALGAALADVRRDFVRGLGRSRVHAAEERLWRNWDMLTQEAQEWLANEGVTVLSQRLVHAVDMQYSGQSFSLTVTIPPSVQAERRIDGVIEAFHQAHEAIYGFREPDHAVEAVTQRLSIIGEMPKVKLPELPPGQPTPTSRTRRSVFHAGAWLLADVYRREAFGAGSAAIGPAVVEQDDTTLWVLPGWRVTADRLGMLRVDRIANAA